MASSVSTEMTISGITANHQRLREDLEKQELEVPGGIPHGQVYSKLLAVYLLENDFFVSPKLKVQREILMETDATTAEDGLLWNVGQKLWQRDFPGIYASLNQEWSESVAEIMQALMETTRMRAVQLVSGAYSSISTADFSGFVGLAVEQAAELARQHGWHVDVTSSMIHPAKLASLPVLVTPSEEQLMKLTDFVSFLEN